MRECKCTVATDILISSLALTNSLVLVISDHFRKLHILNTLHSSVRCKVAIKDLISEKVF